MKIIGVGAALGMAAIALLAPPSTARGVPEDVTIDIHVERGCPTPDSGRCLLGKWRDHR